jgi:hypothetical protein
LIGFTIWLDYNQTTGNPDRRLEQRCSAFGSDQDSAFELAELDVVGKIRARILQKYCNQGNHRSETVQVSTASTANSPPPRTLRDLRLKNCFRAGGAAVEEVTKYLDLAPQNEPPILSFWKAQTANSATLVPNAIEILAIPASAMQSERENSRAKYVITDL